MVRDNGIRGTFNSSTTISNPDTNNTISNPDTNSNTISNSKVITRATSTSSSKDRTANNSMGRTEVMGNNSMGNNRGGIRHREDMGETAIIVVVMIRETNTTVDSKGFSRGSNMAARVISDLTLSHMEHPTRNACVLTKDTMYKLYICMNSKKKRLAG